MTAPRRPLVAGNWKMNGLKPAASELGKIVQGATALPSVDLLVCPPATLVMMFASATHGSSVAIGLRESATGTVRPTICAGERLSVCERAPDRSILARQRGVTRALADRPRHGVRS